MSIPGLLLTPPLSQTDSADPIGVGAPGAESASGVLDAHQRSDAFGGDESQVPTGSDGVNDQVSFSAYFS